jgi:tRNA (cmo5U34)-methyltransferase
LPFEKKPMSKWTDTDSAVYREIAPIAVPRRDEMMRTLIAAVPFSPDDTIRIVELGAGEGELAAAFLNAFPRASVTALDGSASMRDLARARLEPFGERARFASFDVATLDWWDVMFGADLVASSLCLHHLNDAKKQYVYKAAADRMSERGALLVADLVLPTHPSARKVAADEWDESARAQAEDRGEPERYARFVEAQWNFFRYPDDADQPSALLHHLVWLRHAGFAAVDCFWQYAGHAVFGGFKSLGAAASARQPPAGN